MKTSVKIIIGAALFVLVAGAIGICIYRHYDHRGMRDAGRGAYYHQKAMTRGQMMGRDRMARMPVMRGMRPGMERGPMNGMGRGMVQDSMMGMQRGMGPGNMNRMGRGMEQMPMGRMGRGNMGYGRMMDIIPNLTEKQKKEITDLGQRQMDEMKKLRDDMTGKMQSLRDAHRKKVMDLLTAEQKKFVESRTGITNPAPTK